ncbi:ribonuclease J [Candidatus Bathyarchaeota archaeon]|nr:ribonuclease J [Candidatus Bathyarchaeota archaeon]
MTSLTFFGGVGEVGGNKILIKDEDASILLDFGRSFNLSRDYYSPPYLAPRNELELLELGILPRIIGVYRFDDSEKRVDAVFLSHSHLDHAGHITFLKRSIPIYCGETTATILKAISKMSRASLELNFNGLEFHTFRTGDKVEIGSIQVEPIHVDHSVPGAYGFIIHTSAGSVVYTGDFRVHGIKPEMSLEFLEKAGGEKPLAMVCEGTNITKAEVSDEKELIEKLDSVVKNTPGVILADFSKSDIDRLKSFYGIARQNDRKLVINVRQAYLLHMLREDKKLEIPSLKDDFIYIHRKTKKKTYRWENEIVNLVGEDKILGGREIEEDQADFIVVLSLYDFEELIRIKPKPGSCYILSSSEPVNEEMELDYNRLTNWLSHYGIPHYHIHVSGHIMPLQLRRAIEEVNPKFLFPVHCENPEAFRRFLSDLPCKIVLPVKGREYVF